MTPEDKKLKYADNLSSLVALMTDEDLLRRFPELRQSIPSGLRSQPTTPRTTAGQEPDVVPRLDGD